MFSEFAKSKNRDPFMSLLTPSFLTRFQNSLCEFVCIATISGHQAYLLTPIVTALIALVAPHLHIQEKLRATYKDGLNSTAS